MWRYRDKKLGSNSNDRGFKMRNNRGFSLTEVIISMGLMAVFVALAGSIVKDIYVLTEKDKNQLDAETDLTFAMRYLGGVFKDAGPSFNNVKGNLDDNGREFFDQLFDVSTALWDEEDPDRTRTFTMDPTKGRLHFYFYTNSSDQVDPLFYNPIDAYKPVAPIMDQNSSAALDYLNFNNGNAVSKYAPDIWKDGNLILLKVPVPLRFVATDGTVNMYNPAREHSMLGTVVGANLIPDTFATHAYTTHPIDNSPITSTDIFLKKVPTVGGASPVVEVLAVKGYRISLVPRGKYYDLYSYQYKNGNFEKPLMIAANIKKVVLRREEVSLPLITVRVSIEKKTTNQGQ